MVKNFIILTKKSSNSEYGGSPILKISNTLKSEINNRKITVLFAFL